MEFALKSNITEISFTSKFVQFRKKQAIRRDRGKYFIELDPTLDVDVQQFKLLFEAGHLELDGHSPKELARFDSAFHDSGVEKIRDELQDLRSKLPGVESAAVNLKNEVALLKAASESSDELKSLDSLLDEIETRSKGADRAERKVEVAKKRIANLEKQLRDQVQKAREAEAAALFAKAKEVAQKFNDALDRVYSDFWREITPLLAGTLSAWAGESYGGVYFQGGQLNVGDVAALTSLRGRPSITPGKYRLNFDIKRVERA